MESYFYIVGFENGMDDALDGLSPDLDPCDPYDYIEGYWDGYYQALGIPRPEDDEDDY